MIDQHILQVARAHFARRREKLRAITTPQTLAARQAEIRETCGLILGSQPERTPLETRSIHTLERDGYSVEALTYQSRPGIITTANLYLPQGQPASCPGMLCMPGPWPEGKAHPDCQRTGQLLARRGIAALVLDLVGQGERLEFYDATLRRSWLGRAVEDEHAHLGNLMLLTGHSIRAWMVWDAMRALDLLVSHAHADPNRLGAAGASGGLMRLLCALEPRLSCAAVAIDAVDSETLGGEIQQTLCNAIPRGLNALDFLVPLAPRPLLLVYATGERPHTRVESNLSELRHWFALLGKPDNVSAIVAESQAPGFPKDARRRMLDHFAQSFGMSNEMVREPETPPEPAELLYATETGQVSNSLNATSVFSLHKQLAREMPPQVPAPKDAASAAELQHQLRAKFTPFLHLPPAAGAVKPHVESHSSGWGFMAEKGRLVLDDWLYVPYSFYTLAGARAGLPTVLALHERGIAGISNLDSWMAAFAGAGVNLMAIDVAGVGETRLQPSIETRVHHANEDGQSNYEALLRGPESQCARRALNAGLSLFGLRVFSVLRTLAWLRTREEVRAEATSVVGVGRGGLWGIYAAALDGTIARAVAVRSLATYKSLVEHRRHNHHFSLYLPGCLRQFDLPHVAACIAPRPLTLINPVNQRKDRCPAQAVAECYGLTSGMYAALSSAAGFRILQTDSAPETLAAVIRAVSGS
jgi:dienelactone hydrolase